MSSSVSIVIPAYNEAGRIASTLTEVLAFARDDSRLAEIIVVDDGSTDHTPQMVLAASIEAKRLGGPPIQLVRHETNRGKGASVRTGFQHSTCDIVLFSDADLSAPISEMPLLVDPIIAGECDITIGSRALANSRIELQQSLFRRNAGRMFNLMVRVFTGLQIHDTQCGFKAFRRSAALPVFSVQRIEGFAFDVELLYVARRAGLRIRELPVRWSHAEGSKVSMLRHTREMAFDLARIRWNSMLGRYATDAVRPADPCAPAVRTCCHGDCEK